MKSALVVRWICIGTVLGQVARAQVGDPDSAASDLNVRPTVTIVRTDAPPVIDGILDDEVWASATHIDEFTQVDPIEGAAPTERTLAMLMFDGDYLYVGVRCFDRNPRGIRATTMERDPNLNFDDVVAISIDPFFNLRDGFFFEMGPAGSKGDALIEANERRRFEWDGIWEGKATIDDGGWSVEISIPFKTLNFNPDTTRWGFNVEREIRRRQETVRWASPIRTRQMANVSNAGIIEGIEEINQGIGLDLKPFVTLKYTDDRLRGDQDFKGDAGLDLFYKITPELTLALTVNTDFAETEVDQRQVNLTRFSLFFPEKRDFFLQDAGIFEFGGIRRNPLPFFSRRIGIGPDGEPVDIIAGAKLTGRVGDANIGLLNVQLDDARDVDATNVTVGRVQYNIWEESTIGLITTVGDPQTDGDNFLIGADLNFRDSKRVAPGVLEGNAYFMHTESSDLDGNQNAFGGRFTYESDTWRFQGVFTQIDENFNPALGFSNRRGIREYIASGRYRWRPGTWIKRVEVDVRNEMITSTDDKLETRETRIPEFEVENRAGDTFRAVFTNTFEHLEEDFEIQDGIIIPEDDYTFNRGRFTLASSRSRPIRAAGTVEFGEFFSGDRLDLIGSLDWRPSRYFALNLEYEYNDVNLPEGDFIVRIARTRFDVSLNPDLSWITIVQWDNISEVMGINSRVKWIIEPGQEIFFVVNQGFSTEDDDFESLSTELTLKVGLTIRF